MKEMTPYNSFCVARRPLLPAGLSSSERNVQLGKMWNALSQAEKDQYKGAVAPMVAKVDPTPPPTQVGPSVPFVPQQQLAAPAGPISAVPLVPVGGGHVALPDSPVKLAAATTPLPLGHSHHAAPTLPALPAVAAVVPIARSALAKDTSPSHSMIGQSEAVIARSIAPLIAHLIAQYKGDTGVN